jgi:hypothetical protein
MNAVPLLTRNTLFWRRYGEHIEDPGVDATGNAGGDVHEAENEQGFLTKQKQLLGKDKDAGQNAGQNEKMDVARPRPHVEHDVPRPNVHKTPSKPTADPPGPTPRPDPAKKDGKDVLTDFFESLLKTGKDGKKAPTKGGATAPATPR